MIMKRRRFAVVACALSLLGCSHKKTYTAEQYFREANHNFRNGTYYIALEQYRDLIDQFPFSQFNEEAELKIAHANYLSGNYPEAIVAFTDFQRRHPTSPNLPFVGYYLGMCYAKQVEAIDRDQGAAQNAQNVFLTVIQQYPDSPFALLAREELARCRRNLAEHELYIARYYAKRKNNRAAEIRLLTLASRYGDTEAAADGLLRLATMYRRDKRDDQAMLAYLAIEQKQPGSVQAGMARSALEQLAGSEEPPEAGDPLDRLLAANGRQRGGGSTEIVQVPGLESAQTARRPSGGGAGQGRASSYDPFGRGSPY
jgi:outer membrane protein assembly factor BamD